MSSRRRGGSWQEEVAKGFSRFFSRTPSQDKEEENEKKTSTGKGTGDEQERADKGFSGLFSRASSQDKKEATEKSSEKEAVEEQGRVAQGSSELVSRGTSQDNKEESEGVCGRGTKGEQERAKDLSKVFTRASSQDKEEESGKSKSKVNAEEPRSQEDKTTNLTTDNNENLSSTEPIQIIQDTFSVPTVLNSSTVEEEKQADLTLDTKTQEYDKQPRDNFFQFFGNLFNFASKPTLGNPKRTPVNQEHCKESEDAQVQNNLDEGWLNQEQTLAVCSATAEATEEITTNKEEILGVISTATREVEKQEHEETPIELQKQSGGKQDAPAVTYGTYRGSRRIRKLLKRRPDINSPIPEKEEAPDRDTATTISDDQNSVLSHQRRKREQVADLPRINEEEVPPAKIHIKNRLQPREEENFNSADDLSKIAPNIHAKIGNDKLLLDNNLAPSSLSCQVSSKRSSVDQQFDGKENGTCIQTQVDLQLNADTSCTTNGNSLADNSTKYYDTKEKEMESSSTTSVTLNNNDPTFIEDFPGISDQPVVEIDNGVFQVSSEHLQKNERVSSPCLSPETNNSIHHATDPSCDISMPQFDMNTNIVPIHGASESVTIVGNLENGNMPIETALEIPTAAENSNNSSNSSDNDSTDQINITAKETNDVHLSMTFTDLNSVDMSKTIMLGKKCQDDLLPNIEPVTGNHLNNICSLSNSSRNDSHVKESAQVLLSDDCSECQSPPLTTASDPLSSPITSIDVRCNSPLPPSDGVDSGIVSSSKEYTPDEDIPVRRSPDLHNNIESVPLATVNGQDTSITGLVESDRTIPENSVIAAHQCEGNILPTIEQVHVLSKKETANLHFPNDHEEANCAAYSGSDATAEKPLLELYSSVLEDSHAPTYLNSTDVYVATVSVKSVDVKEVKIAPHSFQSEVVSVGKLTSPALEPEHICLPNLSPPSVDITNVRDFQIPGHTQENESCARLEELSSNIESEVILMNNLPNMSCNVRNLNQVISTDKLKDDYIPPIALPFSECQDAQIADIPSTTLKPEDETTSILKTDTEAIKVDSANEGNIIAAESINAATLVTEYVSDSACVAIKPIDPIIESELPITRAKSPDVNVENTKSDNSAPIMKTLNGSCINIPTQTLKHENEMANEILLSNFSHLESKGSELIKNGTDSQMELEVNHRATGKSHNVLCSVSLKDDLSTCTETPDNSPASPLSSTIPKREQEFILSTKAHPESSDNALLIQKANEIIGNALHSALGEIQSKEKNNNIVQICESNLSFITPDIIEVKLITHKSSENESLKTSADGSEADCMETALAGVPCANMVCKYPESKDPFVSRAEEIVNEVIVSAKQNIISYLLQTSLNKNVTADEIVQSKITKELNIALTDRISEAAQDTSDSSKNVSMLEMANSLCKNTNHIPSCEINSNVILPDLFQSNVASTKESDRYTLKELSCEGISSDEVNISDHDVNGYIDDNIFPEMEKSDQLLQTLDRSDSTRDENILPDISHGDNLKAKVQEDMDTENVKLDTSENLDYNEYIDQLSFLKMNFSDIQQTTNDFSDVIEEGSISLSDTNNDMSIPFHWSVHNGHYFEISESDDEPTDEENDTDSINEANNPDSFLSIQAKRMRMYPFALSPIYEDDSSSEDVLSNSVSPRHADGTTSNNANDQNSILSLLQSVSDRLKQSDRIHDSEEASCEESVPLSNNEAPLANDQSDKDGTGTLENKRPPSIMVHQKEEGTETESSLPQIITLSSMFVTKPNADTRPLVSSGRQSLLLHMTKQSSVFRPKSSMETKLHPGSGNESSALEMNTDSSLPDTNSNTEVTSHPIPLNEPSPLQMTTEPSLFIQNSDIGSKPRPVSRSVYYQYFNATQNYSNNKEIKGSVFLEKLYNSQEDDSLKTQAPVMNPIDRDSLKSNPRPGKVVVSDIIDNENKIAFYSDVLDATSRMFPNGVNIGAIRGCWILYEKPSFQGQTRVLEEGEVVLHIGGSAGADHKTDTITIGSLKRIAKDGSIPEVLLNPLSATAGSSICLQTQAPSLENLIDGIPHSLSVKSGVWLAYAEPQYSGSVIVLEEGCLLSEIQEFGIGSLRPLKMGGLKVQMPNDPKIILYQKPHFEGWSKDLTEHVYSIKTLLNGDDNEDIGSMRVIGGIWVGYEKERYKGQQYLLEEGEYEDWHAWGGFNSTLLSIRYLQADFLESSVTLYESEAEGGKKIDVFNQGIPDLEQAGYSIETRSIHVKKGMWVAYQQKHFCGEQYILEKGRYKSFYDWGGNSNTILSVRPVLLEPLGRNEPKHLVKAYGDMNFQGQCMDCSQEVSEFKSFTPSSFKVLRGCWLLCYQADSSDNLCVLEEGHFPDMASCGCPAAVVKYMKPIDYVFAEPSVSLFALDSCEGRELHFEDAVNSVLSKDLHFYTQSVRVTRGLWIAYEGANFLGRQKLLEAGEILNWAQFSGWKAIGSLRPVKQPAVYFRIKNQHKKQYLTVTGKLTDARATSVGMSSSTGQSTQIWYFCRGLIKSKARDSCLDVIGGKNIPGSKVSLWTEHGKPRQKWSISKDGTITSYIHNELVLDLKGGTYYDQNHIVVNQVREGELTQKWDIEIL